MTHNYEEMRLHISVASWSNKDLLVRLAMDETEKFIVYSKWLCKKSGTRNRIPSVFRLMSKIKVSEKGCWEYIGYIKPNGYGYFKNQWTNYSHRFSYSFFKGEIPHGFQVCHKCDNRKCANPNHLWVGTNKDNCDDAIRKGRAKNPPPVNWAERRKRKKHHWEKLTENQVINIKRALKLGKETQGQIGHRYGVDSRTINQINTGRTWRHV